MPLKVICDKTGKEDSYRTIAELSNRLNALSKQHGHALMVATMLDDQGVVLCMSELVKLVNSVELSLQEQSIKIQTLVVDHVKPDSGVAVDADVGAAKKARAAAKVVALYPNKAQPKRTK